MNHHMKPNNRRSFIKKTGLILAATSMVPAHIFGTSAGFDDLKKVPINAHLWVYASKFPPNWDCSPVLDTVFSDLNDAGIHGVELMEANLRHDNSVKNLNNLIQKYNLPVSGSSYGVGFSMWDTEQHKRILKDIETIIPRLKAVDGKTFGISVGGADHQKTEKELDAQAEILLKIRSICEENDILANLHNHTYEVENDMHDLRGTLKRIPDFKLGPDLNWLIRAGVDPVSFIETYGQQIVYLHIRDQYANGDWTEYVGQGVTNFSAISTALRKQNFQGQVAIELAFPNDFIPEFTLTEDWKKSKEYVQGIFGWS